MPADVVRLARPVRAIVSMLGALGVLAGCGGVMQRFPDDVLTAVAHDDMRRLETDRFILYYPAHRRPEIDRFLARAGRCADALRDAAVIHDGPWRDKMVIAMPEVAFNNAFVLGEGFGYEQVAVIPTLSTLDFTSEYGLVPDPGFIACHELTHYVHFEQLAGFWKYANLLFGHLYTPQNGYDPWFFEGLATHYEAKLSPGVGRPTWPIFTGMFAAGYAGQRVVGGDLSELGRLAPVGHHYLVGSMFVRFMAERYGERPLWDAIANQAGSLTGLLFPSTFKAGFGVTFGTLLDEFEAWHQQTFPARARPPGQRRLATLGNDARYARGRDGTEAWVANDVDVPPRLIVRGPDGATLAELGLVDVVPPRTLVEADPLLVSGLSITADGREVWLTAIDLASTNQVTRLLRWRRGETKLTEIIAELGPGATIDPAGTTYYYCEVDGDRWSLAAWDVRRGTRRILADMAPGTYVLGAQISPDGARLIASVWDGSAFVAWLLDAATGTRLGELHGTGAPIYDASFTDDGRVIYLGVVDGRFQVMVDGQPISDAPYAMLAARAARGTVRFLNREGWNWTLDEIALPAAASPAPATASPVPVSPEAKPGEPAPGAPAAGPGAPAAGPGVIAPPPPPPPTRSSTVSTDEPYHAWDHLFVPQLHSPTFVTVSSGVPHFGAVLGGGDQLGLQRWSIAGYGQYDSAVSDQIHWGADAAYLNSMLAPWQILATAGFVDWVDRATPPGPDGGDGTMTLAEDRRTRDASLSIERTWRGTLTTALSGIYTDDYDHYPGEAELHRRLGGPQLAIDWMSVESTAYTGPRRGSFASVATAYYPRALSTFDGDIYDLRGELGVVVPLPFGRRHLLYAELRGRALVAHDDTGLLQLGGDSGLAELWNGSSVSSTPSFDDARFPPNLRFIESLRGYEDYAITTDRAAVADVWWHYPLIIDRGVASTLWYLPASFVSELDFELFATGAVDRARDLHAAVGGEVTALFTLFRVPLELSYQLARRVRDDDALTQLVGLGLGVDLL
ncbi:MAG TPA: WD40 repeat domain-containing protein [Kofleriaceae bacterium]|jgi:hypothetical protein|nr:WD40 repeat domain-containing protein [Kofleriaceae bacterium]